MNCIEDAHKVFDKKFSRRSFLKLGMLAFGASLIPKPLLASIPDPSLPDLSMGERSLSFHNPHNGESLDTIYWCQGDYVPESLAEIDFLFRDHYTEEIKPIDPQLLDLLYILCMKLKHPNPTIHVVSGYRCRFTNDLLRKSKRGVAKDSYHLYGKAVDLSIPGCSVTSVHKAAVDIKGGGVGYYPSKKFIHVDVGPIRYW